MENNIYQSSPQNLGTLTRSLHQVLSLSFFSRFQSIFFIYIHPYFIQISRSILLNLYQLGDQYLIRNYLWRKLLLHNYTQIRTRTIHGSFYCLLLFLSIFLPLLHPLSYTPSCKTCPVYFHSFYRLLYLCLGSYRCILTSFCVFLVLSLSFRSYFLCSLSWFVFFYFLIAYLFSSDACTQMSISELPSMILYETLLFFDVFMSHSYYFQLQR